ncbi:hypothetical protein EDE11_101371 [Methylomonas methanica]|uniref:Uncharacterized protein n=1 Tax=Methylomonas methanica TaxID=421 RepID=A0ABY2CTP4_METMH|nr:hypothetical protein EDE11_101371 [Methylomonas methanica]
MSVLSKEQLLAGGGQFNADVVRDEVVIAVLTYDSLRAKNKDEREDLRQADASANGRRYFLSYANRLSLARSAGNVWQVECRV